MDRMQKLEDQFTKMQDTSEKYIEVSDDLAVMFKRDYDEFIRDRRRWKSDFDVATLKAQANLGQVEQLLSDTLTENKVNS